MELGLVGLGRMGANMSRRWLHNGHTVVGYARTAATVEGMVADAWGTTTRSCGSRILTEEPTE
jgi:6-phosphogluconate dehydrogenase (decarboxylating)